MNKKTFTLISGFRASALASIEVTVLFPTPPFPDKIRILCLTSLSFSWMRGSAASGLVGFAEEQIC